MKRKQVVLGIIGLTFPLMSFDRSSLLNHPMPVLSNETLDGKVIDANYYKDHLTIVSFMYIGCPPCMNEIGLLNRITREYRSDSRVQVLCIARQMKKQMVQFNSNEQTVFSSLRKAMGAEPIEYAIQPACNDGKSTMDSIDGNVTLKSECTTIEDVYGVDAFPTIFFVDNKGIIRKIQHGGPAEKNDSSFYHELKGVVDSLLSVQ